jgi:radical SAM protein with 4Fe4S-binding SPASM domain
VVFWEATRACSLSCRACLNGPVAQRAPGELSTGEAERLFGALAASGTPPHIVITGGDPLERPDLSRLVACASRLGLAVTLELCPSSRLTQTSLIGLASAGARHVAFALDGASSGTHDNVRGAGSFDRTMAAIRWAVDAGLSVEAHTIATERSARDLAEVYELVARRHVDRWVVHLAIPAMRTPETAIDSYVSEAILTWLCDVALESARPRIVAQEAPFYKRIAAQHRPPAATTHRAGIACQGVERRLDSWYEPLDAVDPVTPAVRDGRGMMFVSHTGEVCPSPFARLSAGNVRQADPLQLYRDAALFRSLQTVSTLTGRCAACPFAWLCGGSRARAWVATGNLLAEDPACPYERGHVRAGVAATPAR